MIIISLVEAIYVIYMLNFFKTRYSFAHPLTYFDNRILRHPIGKSSESQSQICPFGHVGAYVIAFFIIVRLITLRYNIINVNTLLLFNKLALMAVFIFSLLNFNAVLYLIPFFIIEGYLIMTHYKMK
jgi:hypothetical protein